MLVGIEPQQLAKMQRSSSKNNVQDSSTSSPHDYPLMQPDGSQKVAAEGFEGIDVPNPGSRNQNWGMVAFLFAVVPVAAAVSHLASPKQQDGRELSEAAWYSVDVVKLSQRHLSDFDGFLSFISSASNPAQILHRVVPLLACTLGPQAALKVLVAYVVADVSNLALKWPLQGDRPFWMDATVRQFGGNTCEVGFGMPSGHVQVTVAGYATLAGIVKIQVVNWLVLLAVLLTALSRVHMGAHTPLQVTCGCLAGLGTALGIRAAEHWILQWGSHLMPNRVRLIYAGVVIAGLVIFLAVENALLLSWDVAIYASISHAIKACRGGLHAVVSSARGIARDIGALLGGTAGVCCRYMGAPFAVGPRLSLTDLVVALAAAEVSDPREGFWFKLETQGLLGFVFV
jgi:hypothetical protein